MEKSESQCCGGNDCTSDNKDQLFHTITQDGLNFVELILAEVNGVRWAFTQEQLDRQMKTAEELRDRYVYSVRVVGNVRLLAATCE